MRRNLKTLLGLTLSVLLLPALAMAAQPFGAFGGLSHGQNAGGGILPLTGWALDRLLREPQRHDRSARGARRWW